MLGFGVAWHDVLYAALSRELAEQPGLVMSLVGPGSSRGDAYAAVCVLTEGKGAEREAWEKRQPRVLTGRCDRCGFQDL